MRLRFWPTLWWRHCFGRIVGVFLSFLLLLASLYIAIDYCVHSKLFALGGLSKAGIAVYYGVQLSQRATFLVALALLLAAVKTMTDFNERRELLALQAAGLSKRRLLTPLFVVCAFAILLLYLNFETAYPRAMSRLSSFQEELYQGGKKASSPHIQLVPLSGNERLIYQTRQHSPVQLFDLYWLRQSEIVHMASLEVVEGKAIGRNIDRFKRTAVGRLEHKESLDLLEIPELSFDWRGQRSLLPFDWLSLSESIRELLRVRMEIGVEDSERLAILLGKLIAPLMGLLAVIAVIPFCLGYSRHLPVFLLYCLALLIFLFLQTLLGAGVILAKHQVFPSAIILIGPLVLVSVATLPRLLMSK